MRAVKLIYCVRETRIPYVRYKNYIGVSIVMKKRHVALAAAICMALANVGFVSSAFAAEKMMMLIYRLLILPRLSYMVSVILRANLFVQHLMLVF